MEPVKLSASAVPLWKNRKKFPKMFTVQIYIKDHPSSTSYNMKCSVQFHMWTTHFDIFSFSKQSTFYSSTDSTREKCINRDIS